MPFFNRVSGAGGFMFRAWLVVRNSDHRHDVTAEYLLGLCGGHDSPPGSVAG